MCDGTLMATTTVLVSGAITGFLYNGVSQQYHMVFQPEQNKALVRFGEWNIKGAGPHTCHTAIRTSTATLHTFALLVHV